MPYNTKADNDVLTASFWNANVRDQVVSTVTAATRPSGTAGEVIYETDSALFKAYLAGWLDFGGLGAWQTWTPTLTQSSVVTATVGYGVYYKLGRRIRGQCTLTCTSAGVANNIVTVSIPGGFTAAGPSGTICGTGVIRDTSATANAPGLAWTSGTTAIGLLDSTQATNNLYLGQTGSLFPNALASTDIVRFDIELETTA